VQYVTLVGDKNNDQQTRPSIALPCLKCSTLHCSEIKITISRHDLLSHYHAFTSSKKLLWIKLKNLPRHPTSNETNIRGAGRERRQTETGQTLNDHRPAVFQRDRIIAKSFVMSVRKEQLGSHWTDFYRVWYLSFFPPKIYPENSSLIKANTNNVYFTWRHFHIHDNVPLNYS
jgi:hypothetical protein